ncbi:polyubiquitin-like, partial [Penaeus japonicus]|uniref:polyubiquitin-like n=1 Tax=Penaeus japonicus TaxID=27405 RepID=UPI001C70B688
MKGKYNVHRSKRLAIEVRPQDNVEELKAVVESKTNIPIHRQILYYDGKLLANDRTLASYNLGTGTMLHLSLLLGAAGMFSLSVIMPSNKVIQIVVHGTTTIKELMKTLEGLDQTLKSCQHFLMVGNDAMDSSKTLWDYGIRSEAVIRLEKAESTCS